MMDYQRQLKLQAYLDEELTDSEARAVADSLAGDPEAESLLAELRQTHSAVAGFERGIVLPETREFYWSKIRREIERQERAAPKPEPRQTWVTILRRMLMPATALGMVALMALMLGRHSAGLATDTALQDTGAFTYHDFEKGTTLVWLSYPAENEWAEYEDAMFQ